MPNRRVGIQNKSSVAIPLTNVQQVAQALQVQVDRDFAPIWGVQAQVIPFDKGERVPPSIWLMSIVNNPVGGLGIHLDSRHHPYAQIKDTNDWSVTASHEMLEMLVDPLGHRFVQGPDIDPSSNQHGVHYLMEVGDPCEVYGYTINGIAVSDFVTAEYYDAQAPGNTQFDYLSRLTAAYQVPAGCYISWFDPLDGRWHQKRPNGTFTRAKSRADLGANPRDERDASLGDDEGMRHDKSALLAKYAAPK